MFLNVTFTLSLHLEELKMHVLQSCALKGREQVVIYLHSKSTPVLQQEKNHKNGQPLESLIYSIFTCMGETLKKNGEDVNKCFKKRDCSLKKLQ